MNHLEEVRGYWNTRSEGYRLQIEKEQREGERKQYLEDFGCLQNKSEVLDVGCGPGYFSCLLTELGMSVTAVDYSEEMLRQAEDFVLTYTGKHLNSVRADAQNLPFPSERFDAVVCRNLVWNLDDPIRAYEEWLRVLKPGGRLFVYDGNHYAHLFRPEYEQVHGQVEKRSNHILLGVQTNTIDRIAEELPLSKELRPQWDEEILARLGAVDIRSRVITQQRTREGKRLTISFGIVAVKP